MSTPKQIKARKRNWFIMKTTGMITEINKVYFSCINSEVRRKAIIANKAIKALRKAFIDSKTEDWNG